MKNNKKLVVLAGAAALGLVAATGVTSTFAWFTANNTVTATGMALTAKSDAIFLEIKGANDGSTYKKTGTADVDADLEPIAHETWTTVANIEDFDMATPGTPDNWYHMQADTPDNYASTDTKTYISSFTGYVAKTTFDVRVHTGSQKAYDLYVNSVTFSAANAGLRLIVAGEDGYQEFSTSGASLTYAAANRLVDEIDNSGTTITAYLYISGEDENVFTANIANLTGSVEFTLNAANAARS